MADLIAIGYPDETTADAAAAEARRLAQDLIIQPDAIAVIVRDKDGSYHVHTSHHPVGAELLRDRGKQHDRHPQLVKQPSDVDLRSRIVQEAVRRRQHGRHDQDQQHDPEGTGSVTQAREHIRSAEPEVSSCCARAPGDQDQRCGKKADGRCGRPQQSERAPDGEKDQDADGQREAATGVHSVLTS